MRLLLISILLSTACAMPGKDQNRQKRQLDTTLSIPSLQFSDSLRKLTVALNVTYSTPNITGIKTMDDFGFKLPNINITVVHRDDYNYTNIGAYKFHSLAATWDDAREICDDEGAHLVVIDTNEEEQILLQMYKHRRNEIRNAQFKDRYFIGVHALFPTGRWATIKGDSLTIRRHYQKWYRTLKDPTQNCVALNENGGMDPVTCTYKYAFLCELPRYYTK